MASTSRTFRIFVSSTFSDLKEERNALQRRVFPRLRDLCREHGCRFQAIDLRWGVREEAALDQQTLRICLEEIHRCQRITPRPNFIILLGNRYGWRPLPAEIPEAEYRLIEAGVTAPDAAQLLNAWYRCDRNAVPPVYALQPRRLAVAPNASEAERRAAIDDEARAWRSTETALRRIFTAVVPTLSFSDDLRAKYRASATEQEIRSGALRVADASDHVFCFLRDIEPAPPAEAAGEYFDLDDAGHIDREAQDQLAALKDALRRRLPATIFNYSARWAGHGPALDHLDRFCDDVYGSLSRVILAESERMESVTPLEQEISDHDTFGAARARVFVGRVDALRSIAEYVRGSDSRPLAVWGEPGVGKSALIARASALAKAQHPAVVVCRFVGVTPPSSDGRALLESLCREITRAYGADDAGIPTEFQELAEELPRRLALAQAARPLVVFIDALDQLSDAHYARRLAWLPATLPDHVRLVVSTLPGECQAALEGILPPESLVRLHPMATDEGEQLLALWLQSAGRTLQDDQRTEVMDKFSRDGRPLYLRLAFEEACRWRSSRAQCALSPDIDGIIREFLERLSLEANHGTVVVSRSLGYLAAARNGLTEDELLDLLSQDEAVFRDFLKRSFHEPPERRLPAIVWSRLYFDLEPYLAERSADGASLLTFYHPTTIGRVVRDMYLSDEAKVERHGTIADYFARQQLFVDTGQRMTANARKLSELSYQLTEARRWDDLYATLTDFEFLEIRCTHSGVTTSGSGEKAVRIYTGVYELMEDYRRALAAFPSV